MLVFKRFAPAICAIALLGGCVGTPSPVVGEVSEPLAAVGQGQEQFVLPAAADYRLRPADVVGISVYREPDLSLASIPVSADGNVALPLVGTVTAAGRTSSELAEAIRSALGQGFLVNPQVSVNVIRYESHQVTVEGSVKKPGVFPFAPGARLSSAIAQAEGPERQARLDQIAVFRRNERGLSVAKFDYRAMQAGTMVDPVLQPGDRVVVGTSGLANFWQDVLQSLPAFALFTNI